MKINVKIKEVTVATVTKEGVIDMIQYTSFFPRRLNEKVVVDELGLNKEEFKSITIIDNKIETIELELPELLLQELIKEQKPEQLNLELEKEGNE